MLLELKAHTCWYNSVETVIAGTTLKATANKTATCDFFKTPFSYTAPVFTSASKDPFLFESGLLEYHHLSVTGWAWDLDKCLCVVRDWVKSNGHGCAD